MRKCPAVSYSFSFPSKIGKGLTEIKLVDGLLVGLNDLQCSLGLEPGPTTAGEAIVLAAINRIQRVADANNLAVMGRATAETLEDRLKLGWRAIVCHGDVAGILDSGTQALQACQQIAERVLARSDGSRDEKGKK